MVVLNFSGAGKGERFAAADPGHLKSPATFWCFFLLTAGLTTPWPNCNFCGWGGVGWGGDDDIL